MPKAISPADMENNYMSYYLKIRESVLERDKMIIATIHQGVAMITASLTLSVLAFEKLDGMFNSCVLGAILVMVAFIITRDSQKRVKLFSDILGKEVEVAKSLEDTLFDNDSIKITKRIENDVPYAGMEGQRIYLRGITVFYMVEIGLLVYYVYTGCSIFNH